MDDDDAERASRFGRRGAGPALLRASASHRFSAAASKRWSIALIFILLSSRARELAFYTHLAYTYCFHAFGAPQQYYTTCCVEIGRQQRDAAHAACRAVSGRFRNTP